MSESRFTYVPQGKLSEYVKFIWYSDGYKPPSSKERVLPTGSSQFILNLGSPQFRHFEGDGFRFERMYDHTLVAGPHKSHIFLDPFTRISTMGVVLKPGAVQALFGLPADEFQNRVVSLSDVVNTDLSALRERVIVAGTVPEKFRIIVSYLMDRIELDFRLNPALTYAIRLLNEQNGAIQISQISERTGYSRRRFSDLFRNATGLSPKEYARIRRFQYALRLIRKVTDTNWSRIALECGYFDQAHFNHEFKSLSGLTPGGYYENRTGEINHLPVTDP